MPVKLGYWKIRGLAQPIRLLLAFTGTDFEEDLYESGDAPDYNKDCWLSVKHKLGLEFPNLPYFIDGDIKVVQSNAILRYVARKNNLVGNSEQEKVWVDIMEHQAMDFRNGLVRLCYNPEFESLLPKYKENIVNTLKSFEDFLGNKQFFVGENVTFVDFPMYELLDQHRTLDSSMLSAFPKLKAFCDRIEALPKIAAYMKSDKFISKPLNGKMAKFGGN